MFPLIDSHRLAAFRLGFQGRILKSILGTVIEGDIRKVQDVHGCLRNLDEAAFVLADKLTASEYANLRENLHRAGELHDIVCGIGPVEETVSERRGLEKLERLALERIEFTARRIGQKNLSLAAWQEVGTALAELGHRVAYVYATVPIPAGDWKQLNDAVDRLPTEDHKLAKQFIFGMKYRNLSDLAIKLKDAYDDLCQRLSSPDTPDRREVPTTPSTPGEVPPPPPSVILKGQGKPPLVHGNAKGLLTAAQYDVIQALLDAKSAGSDRLLKDELETKSRHSDARKILKRLADSDRDWKKVISFPGHAGVGYGLI